MTIKSPQIGAFKILEGTGPVILSRVTDWRRIRVLKADVSAITYYIYDLNTSNGQPTLKVSSTASVNDCWYDTYQTAGWDQDSIGYNVAVPLPASAFTAPLSRVKGSRYQVEIIGTPAAGDQFWIADLVIDAMDGLSRGTA